MIQSIYKSPNGPIAPTFQCLPSAYDKNLK